MRNCGQEVYKITFTVHIWLEWVKKLCELANSPIVRLRLEYIRKITLKFKA